MNGIFFPPIKIELNQYKRARRGRNVFFHLQLKTSSSYISVNRHSDTLLHYHKNITNRFKRLWAASLPLNYIVHCIYCTLCLSAQFIYVKLFTVQWYEKKNLCAWHVRYFLLTILRCNMSHCVPAKIMSSCDSTADDSDTK